MHQLPGSIFCVFDNATLVECERPRPLRHNRFIFPSDVNSRTQRDNRIIEQRPNLLYELSHLNASILFDKPKNRDLVICRATILNALAARGLLTRTMALRRQELIDDIVERYKPLRMLGNFAIDFSADALGRLVSRLSENAAIAPTHQLLLIHHLLGTWESFQSQYEWLAAFGNADMAASADMQEESAVREKHRAICLQMIDEFPSISRSSFSRVAGKSFRWLLRNDSAWLKQRFPKRYGKCSISEQTRLAFF